MAHATFLSNLASQANLKATTATSSCSRACWDVSKRSSDQIFPNYDTRGSRKANKYLKLHQKPLGGCSQQIGEILKEVMPVIEPAQKPDPLVAIREKELENDTVRYKENL